MNLRAWVRPPRHLLALFVAVTSVSAGALGWAGWKLVDQDRDLARQRMQERQERAATIAAGTLLRVVDDLDAKLEALAPGTGADLTRHASAFAATLPDDAVLLLLRPGHIEAYPQNRLLYYPVLPPSGDLPASTFASSDDAEFREQDPVKALARLRAMPSSVSPEVRGAALLRIARNQRKVNRWEFAIETYREMAQLGEAPIEGLPAELLARAAICDVLATHERGARLAAEARALADDLHRGRWRLSRPAWDAYAAALRRWLGDDEGSDLLATSMPLVLSEAALDVWNEWSTGQVMARRNVRWVADAPLLLAVRPGAGHTAVLVSGPSFLPSLDTQDARITLVDVEGRVVTGRGRPSADYAVEMGAAIGLPWTIYAAASGPPAAGPFAIRSQLVVAGLAAIVLLVVGGSYLIGRAVMRELRVAQLQTEFVSAVSHEFRTPLTSLRQMSELLVQGRVADDTLRQQYYEVLQHESGRLQRLVEGLLRFARMEAGAMRLQLEPVDVRTFVREVVDDFGQEAARQGYEVTFEAGRPGVRVSADREALTCALWNLLDNALKYSPAHRVINVAIEHHGGRVSIAVRDRGVGIPEVDRSRMFEKFVRGDQGRSLGVVGTGVGLAVARQIVRRHDGDISVESEVGVGSRFTIDLPVSAASPEAGYGVRRRIERWRRS